jgi:hypothetical protein
VNVVVPVGITDSTVLPLTNCAIVNWPTTLLPLVTSVARIVAICVAALFGTTMRTVALPFWSLVTVSEDTSGWPGAVLDSAKLPCTTSNRTSRPASGAPAGPSTCTDAVPS